MSTEAPQFTQEEADLVAKDPAAHWTAVHQQNLKNIDMLIGSMKGQLDPIFIRYMSTFRAVIEAQSQEITIHRSFESLMRLEKGDEEDALAYLNALIEMRQALAEKAKAATQHQNQQ